VAPTRRLVIPLLVTAVVIAGIWGTIMARDVHPRLGLDLRGGTSVIFQPIPVPGDTVTGEKLNQTVDIIRARVNGQGVAESEVSLEGGNIVVSIPDVRDPDQVIKAVGTTAQLRMRPVLESVPASDPRYKQGDYAKVDCTKPAPADNPAKDAILCAKEPGQAAPTADSTKLKLGPAGLQGRDIDGASAQVQTNGQGISTGGWVTQLQFSGAGEKKFTKLTGDLAKVPYGDPKRELAITLDGVVISHPPIAEDVQPGVGITGNTSVITGQSEQEAKTLAPLIDAGALPLSLSVLTRNTVSATLGEDSLRAGLIAGIAGLAIVLLYLISFYRGLGMVVAAGLLATIAIDVGVILLMGDLIGFTLTLAGIAGLIVAIGISADSYIIFFERIKDELREGRTVRAAVDRGWQQSFRTLIAADTISFAAAVVLYALAIGPVRGFAFTLGVATIIDVFKAWFFARPTVTLLARTDLLRSSRLFGLRAATGLPAGTGPEGAKA
jgi:preprotein translocase subunit SecD